MDVGQFRTIPPQTLATIQQTAIQPVAPTISPVRIFVLALGAVGIGFLVWSHYKTTPKKPLTGADPDPRSGLDIRSHHAKKKRDPILTYFVDPETGDVIELDLRTAKYRREGETEFRGLKGPSMLKVIAAESKSPEEFARRAEAWASSEATPPSIAKIAAAYRRAKPGIIAKLVREARKKRLAQTDTRWKRMISEPDEEEYVEIF